MRGHAMRFDPLRPSIDDEWMPTSLICAFGGGGEAGGEGGSGEGGAESGGGAEAGGAISTRAREFCGRKLALGPRQMDEGKRRK